MVRHCTTAWSSARRAYEQGGIRAEIRFTQEHKIARTDHIIRAKEVLKTMGQQSVVRCECWSTSRKALLKSRLSTTHSQRSPNPEPFPEVHLASRYSDGTSSNTVRANNPSITRS